MLPSTVYLPDSCLSGWCRLRRAFPEQSWIHFPPHSPGIRFRQRLEPKMKMARVFLYWEILGFLEQICSKRKRKWEKAAPQLLWAHQKWSLIQSIPNLPGTQLDKIDGIMVFTSEFLIHSHVYVGWVMEDLVMFSPAIIPSDPSKLSPGEGRHTGGKATRSTCSPIQQTLLVFSLATDTLMD